MEALGMWEDVLNIVDDETGNDERRLFLQDETWDGTQYIRSAFHHALHQSLPSTHHAPHSSDLPFVMPLIPCALHSSCPHFVMPFIHALHSSCPPFIMPFINLAFHSSRPPFIMLSIHHPLHASSPLSSYMLHYLLGPFTAASPNQKVN